MGQSAANAIAFLWANLCLRIIPLRVVVKGRTNYKKNHPYVVVANHQSMTDIPALVANIHLHIKWIMKKELKKIPIFGVACTQLGCIYVDRSDHDAAIQSIERSKQKLADNAAVLFFAEGTRSKDGKVMPFKKGAFRFAMETGLPILPITIKKSHSVLPTDSLDLRPGTIEIIIHRPIDVFDYHEEKLDDLIENTQKIIADEL